MTFKKNSNLPPMMIHSFSECPWITSWYQLGQKSGTSTQEEKQVRRSDSDDARQMLTILFMLSHGIKIIFLSF